MPSDLLASIFIWRSDNQLTKYNDNRNRGIPKDTGVPISLPNYEQIEIDSHKEFYCSYCNLRLSKLQDRSGLSPSWYCSKCVIEYPDKSEAKSKSHLLTPQKSNNENPRIAYPLEPTIGKKKKELTGSFKVLRDKGMKFTSVTESNTK
jgi:hypothetical protein